VWSGQAYDVASKTLALKYSGNLPLICDARSPKQKSKGHESVVHFHPGKKRAILSVVSLARFLPRRGSGQHLVMSFTHILLGRGND